MNDEIPRIVLTGGPCAGKTTAISEMVTWAREMGYLPIVVPEAATTLMIAGLDPRTPAFQKAVLGHVLHNEAILQEYAQMMAKSGVKPVLICDRGLWDQNAYMGEDAFTKLCRAQGVDPYVARGSRYTGVIYLRSAAVGAEKFYTKANNQHRYETLQEARELDVRTLQSWTGVSHLDIVDNRTDQSFEDKVRRAVSCFAKILGIPEPMEAERKFEVRNFHPSQLPAHAVKSDIVQNYLVGESGMVERVRARSYGGQWVYTHTIKQFVQPGVAVERERIVTRAQYDDLLIRVDRTRDTIFKDRYCFLCGNHHCELDVFKSGQKKGTTLLEIEVHTLTDEVELPDFLQMGEEMTHDVRSSNYSMSAV